MTSIHTEQVQLAGLHVQRDGKEEAMRGYLAHPAAGPAPGIVLLHEIFGVNEAMREKARALAAEGFAVVVPDLFWRIEPGVDLGYSEDDRKQGFGLWQEFDEATSIGDVVAVADWLRSHEKCAGDVAYVGFCLGGRIAVLAGARDSRTRAVVSFYGVRLDAITEALRGIGVPFQFHVGDQDAHVPAAAVDAVKAALADRADAEVFVYPGAQHGFFNPLRTDVHDAEAAALARERLLAVLRG